MNAPDVTLRRHQPRLSLLVDRHCRRRGLNATQADDCVAEVLAHLVVHSLPRFDPAKGGIEAYLYACAINEARSAVRRRGRERRAALVCLDPAAIDRDGRNAHVEEEVEEWRMITLMRSVMRDPEAWGFTARQTQVLRMLMLPRPKRELARRLGYADPASLSDIIARIRTRLLQLADGQAGASAAVSQVDAAQSSDIPLAATTAN